LEGRNIRHCEEKISYQHVSNEKRSLQKKVDTQEELLARVFDAAASTKKHEDRLRRTSRDLRTRVH
jgi:hypothetical protein